MRFKSSITARPCSIIRRPGRHRCLFLLTAWIRGQPRNIRPVHANDPLNHILRTDAR